MCVESERNLPPHDYFPSQFMTQQISQKDFFYVPGLEFRHAPTDTDDMSVSMFTVKPDLTPHDQLRLLEAWDAWGIPRDQQRDWQTQLFGPDFHSHLSDYVTYEAIHPKDDQLELPFDTAPSDSPSIS